METGGDENRTHHIFQKKMVGGFPLPAGVGWPFPGHWGNWAPGG